MLEQQASGGELDPSSLAGMEADLAKLGSIRDASPPELPVPLPRKGTEAWGSWQQTAETDAQVRVFASGQCGSSIFGCTNVFKRGSSTIWCISERGSSTIWCISVCFSHFVISTQGFSGH